MANTLYHSAADVVRNALVGLGVGTHPDVTPGGSWPIYVNAEPMDRDNRATVNDTTPMSDGRSTTPGSEGELWERFGIQVLLLAESQPVGALKADEFKTTLAKSCSNVYVNIPANTTAGIGEHTYLLEWVGQISGVIYAGRDAPNSHRVRYSINAMCTVRLLT